jgi:hypothetical protein
VRAPSIEGGSWQRSGRPGQPGFAGDQPAEADTGVEPPEYLHPLDDLSVRKDPVDSRHHLLGVEAIDRWIERRSGDVLELDAPAPAIPSLEESDLPRAERTFAVVEDFDLPGARHRASLMRSL